MTDQITIYMTLAEFQQLPESNLPTELIDGELIVSPAPKYIHQQLVYRIGKTIEDSTGDEPILSPIDIYLDALTVVQPDVCWVSKTGACQLGPDDYWHGGPDLVVEILSPSTEVRDRGVKFDLYERFGVREYWLVQPIAQYIEVFVQEGERFVKLGLFAPDQAFVSPCLGATITVADIFTPRSQP